MKCRNIHLPLSANLNTMKRKINSRFLIFLFFTGTLSLNAQSYKNWVKEAPRFADTFFTTPEAQRIGRQVMLYQLESGGWPKNINMATPIDSTKIMLLKKQKALIRNGTIDNSATTTEIQFLSRLYQATRTEAYKHSAIKGICYILEAQYDNGGWPQFYPDAKGYHAQITFNDNAMVRVLQLLREVSQGKEPYTFIPDSIRQQSQTAFNKGIQCILDCQVKSHDTLTVWCAQHDRQTLLPCKARAYELPSLSGAESANIVLLLMSIPNPDDRLKTAIEQAASWFRRSAITGYRRENFVNSEGQTDYRMIKSEKAPRLWARFYDLDTNRPFFCGRDGIKRQRVEEIEYERRNGYSWFGTQGEKVLKEYTRWKNKNAIAANK